MKVSRLNSTLHLSTQWFSINVGSGISQNVGEKKNYSSLRFDEDISYVIQTEINHKIIEMIIVKYSYK